MQSWIDLLVTWGPMLLFIGIWWYFMKRSPWISKQSDYYKRHETHMARVEELLARVATALERR